MKRILWIPMLTLILALTSGCGSDSPTGPSGDGGGGGIFNTGGSGTMTASVDGEAFTSEFVTAVRVAGGVVIAGWTDSSDFSIELGFLETESGLILTNEGSDAFATVREDGMFWSTGMLGDGSGTIQINSLTAEGASGSFSFETAENPLSTPLERVVTEGTFNVNF